MAEHAHFVFAQQELARLLEIYGLSWHDFSREQHRQAAMLMLEWRQAEITFS
jgi:hypothetical protein